MCVCVSAESLIAGCGMSMMLLCDFCCSPYDNSSIGCMEGSSEHMCGSDLEMKMCCVCRVRE